MLKLALLISTVFAWDYLKHGSDWPKSCARVGQSPIDLPCNVSTATVLNWKYDQPNQIFTDLLHAKVKWNDYSSVISIPDKNALYAFQSWHSWTIMKTVSLWFGTKIEWHAPAEHTINGQKYDLEMQLYMKPSFERRDGRQFKGSAIGILFDTKNETRDNFESWEIKVIDDMFDSLHWNVSDNFKANEKNMIKVGTFMQMLDTRNRWTYVGSSTTPPCEGPILWHIPTKIYPIK